jgi:hypothetical protein
MRMDAPNDRSDSDVRAAVERIGNRFAAPDPDVDAIVQRARTERTRSRIVAGSVTGLLAIAATFFLVQAFGLFGADPVVVGSSPDPSSGIVQDPSPLECSVGPEGFVATMSPASGPASSTATITGPAPFEHEDQSRRSTSEPLAIEAWFNADASAWEQLIPGVDSKADTSPVLLGRQDLTGKCEFQISFTVPDVAPGTYEVVLLLEGGGGWARYGEGELFFEVAA